MDAPNAAVVITPSEDRLASLMAVGGLYEPTPGQPHTSTYISISAAGILASLVVINFLLCPLQSSRKKPLYQYLYKLLVGPVLGALWFIRLKWH